MAVKRRVSKKRVSKKRVSKKVAPKGKVSLKSESQKMAGYCVKCKAKGREMKNVSLKLTKNGAVQVSGVCTKCGTKMNTFKKKDEFKVGK
jgi:RNase P subunit RPR2